MSDARTSNKSFLSLQRTATRLGVPVAWLRGEAQASRLPHLRIGRRMLFNPDAVERALLERAAQQSEGGGTE